MTERSPETLSDLLDRMADVPGDEAVRLGDILDRFGNRAFGPLLFVPALLAVAPTGAIPGMSIATGSIIILIAVQMFLPGHKPWLPKRLLRIEIKRSLYEKSLARLEKPARRIDRYIGARWVFLTQPPYSHGLGLVCIAMAALMFPFALLPFAVAVPGTAILLLAISLAVRDGYLAAAGLAIAVGACAFAIWLFV